MTLFYLQCLAAVVINGGFLAQLYIMLRIRSGHDLVRGISKPVFSEEYAVDSDWRR